MNQARRHLLPMYPSKVQARNASAPIVVKLATSKQIRSIIPYFINTLYSRKFAHCSSSLVLIRVESLDLGQCANTTSISDFVPCSMVR